MTICIYRITALRPTELKDYHGWQRSWIFQLLLSVSDCGKLAQTTKALPSVSKIDYYLPDNSKCVDSGCRVVADIYRGDGGVCPRFLKFGTSCRWAVSIASWVLYTWYWLAISCWAIEPFVICIISFLQCIALYSTHRFQQLDFVTEAKYSLWVISKIFIHIIMHITFSFQKLKSCRAFIFVL